MTSIKERINYYLKNQKINKEKFFKKIGTSSSNFRGDALKSEVGVKILDKILSEFPELSPIWLLKGDGEMLSSDKNQKGIPYYNVDFTAGFDVLFDPQNSTPHSYVSSPLFDGSDYIVKCSGDSMAPKIPNGCYIGLKQIAVADLLFGEVYAIVTDSWRTIKYVRKSKSDNNLLLVPENKIDYDEQELQINKIRSVWMVVAYGVKLN